MMIGVLQALKNSFHVMMIQVLMAGVLDLILMDMYIFVWQMEFQLYLVEYMLQV